MQFSFQPVFFFESSGLPIDWQGEPHIATNPKPQKIQPATKLALQCAAFGVPAPSYQWYRNGQPLLDMKNGTLQVRRNGGKDEVFTTYLWSHCVIH